MRKRIGMLILVGGLMFAQYYGPLDKAMRDLEQKRQYDEWKFQMDRQYQQQERFERNRQLERMMPRPPVSDPRGVS